MRGFKYFWFFFLIGVSLFSDTIDLGNSVFYSDEGLINIAADAGVAARNLDSTYLMFVLYMGSDNGVAARIDRKDVVLFHKDMVYNMPEIKEFRKNYRGGMRDVRLYNRLDKSALVFSQMRYYRFSESFDYFPWLGSGVSTIDEASIGSDIGFRSSVYFKNPGLKKGDVVIIKVRDKNDPEIWGAVAVRL